MPLWPVASSTATAAAEQPSREELENRIEELEKDIQQLRKDTRGLEVREEERGKLNPAIEWKDGIRFSTPDGGSTDVNLEDDFDFAGRFFATPFKDTPWEPVRGLGVGFAGTYGTRKGTPANTGLPTYLTSLGQQTFFSYVDNPATANGTPVADGTLYRYSPQATWYWGPFGSLAEYVLTSTDVVRGPTEANVHNDAWQVRFSYVLTGENASYNGVTPDRPFTPFGSDWGWGAFEAAFRYDGLKVQNDAFTKGFANGTRSANKAQGFTWGLNWYWNRSVLVALDYGHTFFDGGAEVGDREPEDVLSTRFQFFY